MHCFIHCIHSQLWIHQSSKTIVLIITVDVLSMLDHLLFTAWDQNPKCVKFYVTLAKVHTLPEENINCTYTNRSVELTVQDLGGKDYIFTIKNLLHPVNPNQCSWRVKTGWFQIFVQNNKVMSTFGTIGSSAKPIVLKFIEAAYIFLKYKLMCIHT